MYSQLSRTSQFSRLPRQHSDGAIKTFARTIELPTVFVAATVYGGFIAMTWFYDVLPLIVTAPVVSLLLTLHNSLQHETIHGHPTHSKFINRLIGSVPLSLWLPYALYEESHLEHHRQSANHLTDPGIDPESHYLNKGAFSAANALARAIFRFNATLAGRLTIGPAVSIVRFWSGELRSLARGDNRHLAVLASHLAQAAGVVIWLTAICHIPIAVYLALMVYPGISLNLLRSFAEHRAHPNPAFRTAVVQAHPFWAFLFLNNNLHVAHHAGPGAAWYRLPAIWRDLGKTVEMNRDLLFVAGYRKIAATYFFRPVIDVELSGASERAPEKLAA